LRRAVEIGLAVLVGFVMGWLQAGKLTKHRAAAGDWLTYPDVADAKQLLEVRPIRDQG